MSSQHTASRPLRIPEWLRIRLPDGPAFSQTDSLLHALQVHTVCEGARCPNRCECFSRKVATFLLLGRVCSRSCTFCNISSGPLSAPDPDEPRRIAQAAKELKLEHVVMTSVTRDDLPDGGASHFAAAVYAVREAVPACTVEVLIPDFQGSETALGTVIAARPDVLNHNVETVPALYKTVRPQADFSRSLKLLERAKAAGMTTKTGLMAGIGETDEQLFALLTILADTGVDVVTIGQYMRPGMQHQPVARYIEPERFRQYSEYGQRQGIAHVISAPRVRSSYNADQVLDQVQRAQSRQ